VVVVVPVVVPEPEPGLQVIRLFLATRLPRRLTFALLQFWEALTFAVCGSAIPMPTDAQLTAPQTISAPDAWSAR
jgi:hypothetical protein